MIFMVVALQEVPPWSHFAMMTHVNTVRGGPINQLNLNAFLNVSAVVEAMSQSIRCQTLSSI